MTTEVLYQDGSTSTFHDGGGSSHDGYLAIERMRLIMARSALRTYIKSGGKWQVTRNGAQLAIANVIEPITGKKYKRSMKGKHEALADCEMILDALESGAVIYQPTCDVCGETDENVDWCGSCGCCREHCQGYVDCEVK